MTEDLNHSTEAVATRYLHEHDAMDMYRVTEPSVRVDHLRPGRVDALLRPKLP